MSDTIVVMNQGYIQQIGTPEDIYNEPQNAFVADFIGDSNILPATMVEDKVVKMLGATWQCVDVGFGRNKPCLLYTSPLAAMQHDVFPVLPLIHPAPVLIPEY